jgi:leader peptidase (prepilin peptidase)/N-methyltransferase
MTEYFLGLPLDWWQPIVWGLPFVIWTVAWVILGLIVGSFLNVVIHRLPRNESVVHPPSHCPQCNQRIPLKDNLPIFSWLWLKGRCRFCGTPISPRYLGVEVLTGVIFLVTWLRFGAEQPWVALALCVLFAGFIAATFIDLEHLIIPDEITLGGTVVGFAFSVGIPALHGAETAAQSLKQSGLGILVGAGLVYAVLRGGKLLFGRQRIPLEGTQRVVFHETGVILPKEEIPYEELFYRASDAIRLHGQRIELADRCYWNQPVELRLAAQPARIRIGPDELPAEGEPYLAVETDRIELPREAMGLGDVKFMAAIGAFLGWQATVFSLFFSAILGTVVALVLIALGRQKWSGRLGYGPYLAMAALVWAWGGRNWFQAWFGGGVGPF